MRRRHLLAFSLPALLAAAIAVLPLTASAATTLTVAQAVAANRGTATVTGYVVGQPVATNSVLRSGFTGDTAVALADSAAETNTSRMLYVQVTSAYRAAFGLRTNPGLLGGTVTVTGGLGAYFSHPGLTGPTAMTRGGGGTTPPTTPPTPGNAYYADAEGKSGDALKDALHGIIARGHTTISYSQVWEALKVTDQDPANAANVTLFYSGVSRSKTANGGNSGNWNREHVWPQSHGDFGTSNGPGTDLHHLRPEDVSVNSTRGNKDFDNGGSAVSGAPGNFTDGDSWEPRDAVKGDVARMMFYMAVRWEGTDSWPDLELDNSTSTGGAPRLGKLSVLLQWHAADPPTAAERARNETIYTSYQHNRNPFIDRPEWAAAVFG